MAGILENMQGVTKVTNELSELSKEVQKMYDVTSKGEIIDESSIQKVKELSAEVHRLSDELTGAHQRLATTMSTMGSSFSDVLKSMQDVRSANPGEEVTRQLDQAKTQVEAFTQAFARLNEMKMNVDSSNIGNAVDEIKKATTALGELQDIIAKGGNTAALSDVSKVLGELKTNATDLAVSYNALAGASDNAADSMQKHSAVAQQSSMATKALSKDMETLIEMAGKTNKGLDSLFATISGPGTDVRVFQSLKSEIESVSQAMHSLEHNMTSKNVWEKPDQLGEVSQRIENSMQRMIEQAGRAFQESIGKVTTKDLDENMKKYSEMIGGVKKSVEGMMNTLADPNQAPVVEASRIDEVNRSRQEAMNKLWEAYNDMMKIQLDQLEKARNANFTLEGSLYSGRIMGQYDAVDRDAGRAQLMRMAAGHSLGNDYEYNMTRMGHSAANIYRRATVLQNEVNDPNSAMGWQERRAAKSIDFQGIATQAEELARMKEEFMLAKDQFTGLYTKATDPKSNMSIEERNRVTKDAQERYEGLAKMQQDIQKRSISLGRAIKIATPEDKERFGKEVTALWADIKRLVGDAASSGDNLDVMGRVLKVDPKIIEGLREGNNGVKEIKGSLEDAEKQSKSLWSSMKSGISEVLSPLNMLGRGLGALGIGGLGGGLFGVFGQANQMYVENRRSVWESMRTGAAYGIPGDDATSIRNAEDRLDYGARLHAMSGGRVGIREVNEAYNSAMRDVGGGYGVSGAQGAADINELVNKTFAIQKVANIDQGTMNQAYQTFYKDMRMSASEAADAIARVTSTAQASNIPVGKYLQMVTGIAQQYMKIGLTGRDAENVLANLIHQGVRADVARDVASQTGGAIQRFASDNNQVAYAGAMMGMDPWEAIGMSYNSHDSKGDPTKGWAQQMAKFADVMVNRYAGISDDPNVKRKVMGDYFRGMGYDSRTSSMLTNAHMEGNNQLFEKILMEADDKKANPNKVMEDQLAKMAGSLSGQDRVMAEIQKEVYNISKSLGASVGKLLEEMKTAIVNFVGSMGKILTSITEAVANFSKTSAGKAVTGGLEWATQDATHLMGSMAGLYFGKKFLTGKMRMPSVSTSTEARAGSKLFQTAIKNPRASAAVLAGVAALGLTSKAFASPRWEGGDSDGVLGHMANRLDDIHSVLSGEGINIKGGPGGRSAGGHGPEATDFAMGAVGIGGLYYASSRLMGMAGAHVGREATEAATHGLPGLIGRQTPIGARKWLSGAGKLLKTPWTAGAFEIGAGAYDLYDHYTKGDMVAGDKGRVVANAGVNLGYMGLGAAIGSIVPGVGTAIGAGVGGLVGLGVDMFSEKDASGRGFNDRLKNSLTHMFTGKWDNELEDERRQKMEQNLYGKDGKQALTAKLKMLGYSDEQAKAMAEGLYANEKKLEEHGVKLGDLTIDQKAFFAEHAKQLGVNKDGLGKNEDAVRKNTDSMKKLAEAIANSPMGDKINKTVQAKEKALHDKVGAGLGDWGELSNFLGKKEQDLLTKQEEYLQKAKENPRAAGHWNQKAKEIDREIFELRRGMYYVSDPSSRQKHWEGEYDKLSDWQKHWAGPKKDYVTNRLKEDNDFAYNAGQKYKDEYIKSKIESGAESNSLTAEEQLDSTVTAPGSKDEVISKAAEKADESRGRHAKETSDKIIKQGQKQEEQLKDNNKLLFNLTDQEKLLFKQLETVAHDDSKNILYKLEEIRKILETKSFGGPGGSYNGGPVGKGIGSLAAKYESKGDPGLVSDLDGGSYGIYQFNDLGVDAFLKTLKEKNHPAYAMLSKHQKGTKEFGDAWKQAAKQYSDFGEMQHMHIKEKEYDPFVSDIKKKYGLDINSRGAGVQAAIWSTVVQHGQGDGASVMKNALAGKNIASMSDEELLRAIYEERGRNDGLAHFGSQPADIRASVVNRFKNELQDAIEMNKTGFTATGPGSNSIGALMADADPKDWVTGDTAGVNPEMLKRLAALAKAKGQKINIDDGFRTYNQQAGLWEKSDKSGTMVASPGNSRHEAGMAGDFFSQQWVKDLSNEELAKYGLNKPMNYEPWHIELSEARDKETSQLKAMVGIRDHTDEVPAYDAAGRAIYKDGTPAPTPTNPVDAVKSGKENAGKELAPIVSDAQIGTAAHAAKQNTGKAFWDGSLIYHHLGGVDAYYGKSGATPNWTSMSRTVMEAGGRVPGTNRKMDQAKQRQSRLQYDGAMLQDRKGTPLDPAKNIKITPLEFPKAPVIDHAAKIETLAKSLDTNKVLDAADKAKNPALKSESGGKTVDVNITISNATEDFIAKFKEILPAAIAQAGGSVKDVREQVSNMAGDLRRVGEQVRKGTLAE